MNRRPGRAPPRPACRRGRPEKDGSCCRLSGTGKRPGRKRSSAARSAARCSRRTPLSTPHLERLSIDGEGVARHALQRIELGDPGARAAPDRLARRRADVSADFDRGRERRGVARRDEPARALLGRRRTAARRRSRGAAPTSATTVRRRSQPPRSRRASRLRLRSPERRPRWRRRRRRPDRSGRRRGERRLDAARLGEASSSRANAAFAASPASTKRMSARRPRRRSRRPRSASLAARRREPSRREHDTLVRRGAPALARPWRRAARLTASGASLDRHRGPAARS